MLFFSLAETPKYYLFLYKKRQEFISFDNWLNNKKKILDLYSFLLLFFYILKLLAFIFFLLIRNSRFINNLRNIHSKGFRKRTTTTKNTNRLFFFLESKEIISCLLLLQQKKEKKLEFFFKFKFLF